MASKYPWIIDIHSPFDPRQGIKVRHIESGNDGDVCNSIVTYTLLKDKISPYVIDIGVDEGWWSFFVAEINPTATIDAFEPNPESFRSLVKYLDTIPNLRLHNYAVSNSSGFMKLTLQNGQSHSRDPHNSFAVSVPMTTLERYIQGKHIDMIKIDTEGHDLIILDTLKPYMTSIDVILFECTVYWNGNTQEECITNTVNALNYLHSHYPYMYCLSRRGSANLTRLKHDELYRFCNWCFTNKFQTDILVCKKEIVI